MAWISSPIIPKINQVWNSCGLVEVAGNKASCVGRRRSKNSVEPARCQQALPRLDSRPAPTPLIIWDEEPLASLSEQVSGRLAWKSYRPFLPKNTRWIPRRGAVNRDAGCLDFFQQRVIIGQVASRGDGKHLRVPSVGTEVLGKFCNPLYATPSHRGKIIGDNQDASYA